MATTTGQPPAAVIKALLDKPKRFAFIQAVRLLVRAHAQQWPSDLDFLRHGLRICPDLSLAHPGTDITALKRLLPAEDTEGSDDLDRQAGAAEDVAQRDRFALTVTFLSLYGASSPLPTFYTEELLEEAREDRDDSRRFLDIFNQALYVLYYQAFNIYKLGLRTLEDRDERLLNLQFSLLGFGLAGLRESGQVGMEDLACLPIWMRHTRTAAGLARSLELLLRGAKVDIEQCVERRVPVPQDQRARLGKIRLGEDVIGTSVRDLEGAFRVHLYVQSSAELARFVPGGPDARTISLVIRRYLNTPLAWDVVLHTPTVRPGTLGGCALGASSFLSPKSEAHAGPRRYRFVAKALELAPARS